MRGLIRSMMAVLIGVSFSAVQAADLVPMPDYAKQMQEAAQSQAQINLAWQQAELMQQQALLLKQQQEEAQARQEQDEQQAPRQDTSTEQPPAPSSTLTTEQVALLKQQQVALLQAQELALINKEHQQTDPAMIKILDGQIRAIASAIDAEK